MPEEVYRRRRAAVIAGVALAALAVIALLVLLTGGDDGGQGTVAVPEVVGRTQEEATRILSGAGLRVQVTQRDSPVATTRSDATPIPARS